jgi:hypothetical protein
MKKVDEFFQFLNVSRSIRNLLEHFEPIGAGQHFALIPSCDLDSTLRENVTAAVVASMLNLSSIDYARRKYCPEAVVGSDTATTAARRRYIEAYMASKRYIATMLSKVSPTDVDPSLGSFGAAVTLMRLERSFFSAHILYQLGHKYEAYAVSRLILEQIAWAYSAYELNHLEDIKNLATTKCIGRLKQLNPKCGRLYGVLSKKVHIDYESHGEFLRVVDEDSVVLTTHFDFDEYAVVILFLADLFGIVWEISQASHIQRFEAIQFDDGVYSIRTDRPFKRIFDEQLAELKGHANSSPA